MLTTIIPNGGVQSLVLAYAAETASHGVMFDYVVQGRGDPALEQRQVEQGSRIFQVPDMVKHPFPFMKALYDLLKAHPEYQILHIHQNFLNFIPLMAAKAAGVPVRISHSHNSYETSSAKQVLRKIARHVILKDATETWACSELAYEWLYGHPYAEGPHSYVLHNSIDVSRFAFQEERREALRKETGLTDEFVCVCVAALTPRKNQSFLLDVMKCVQDRHPQKPIRLWLVGDGESRAELEETCRTLGIGEMVRFLGIRKDVPDILLQADCFLLPSFAEGLPVSVVEAQVSGLPCILSAYVTREVAFQKDLAFLEVGEEKTGLWAEQILRFSETAVDRAAPLPEAFHYDIHREAAKLSQAYRGLLKSRGN
ncbi:MAG: glycosyltransferase [Dysosmobacter sp.]|nr:glycosyltransferase [Dysosmobacter sp.]